MHKAHIAQTTKVLLPARACQKMYRMSFTTNEIMETNVPNGWMSEIIYLLPMSPFFPTIQDILLLNAQQLAYYKQVMHLFSPKATKTHKSDALKDQKQILACVWAL